MSGSGRGYYKYRCKYWLTFNCQNWVWVNNAPCAHCMVRHQSRCKHVHANINQASGRDDEDIPASQLELSREVFVPRFEKGSLYYTLMEIVASSDHDCGWVLKEPESDEFPKSMEPNVISLTATHGTISQIPNEPAISKKKND